MIHRKGLILLVFGFTLFVLILGTQVTANGVGTTYYVSSSTGNDSNDGLTTGSAFASIDHVNGLNLQPGDTVLFRCGDIWRTESLIITDSGTNSNQITFGSFPSACADKPVFSGARPISGWSTHSGNIYVANLSTGANSGLFQDGVNQLFSGDERLPFGRWPNPGNGDGGYTAIDSQSGSTITDSALPAGNWTGAHAHIKGMRWYILNRLVTGSSGGSLNLEVAPDCWGGCAGWGYFLTNHLGTLDRHGEWFYDAATHHVYLYSTSGAPANVEGSVIISGADEGFHGGIILGRHLMEEISYVTVENIEVSRWFDNGVTTPRNLELIDNRHITIRDLTIQDIDNAAIFLATWVWNAGSSSGWRGGRNILVEDNLIERANHTAVNSYTTNSTFRGNVIRDIALIENLGPDGMGCDFHHGGGFCTRDGMAMRFPVDQPHLSGFGNTIEYNRLERTGSSGIQVFGSDTTIQYNYVQEAGYAKGDNGGISVYGNNGFGSSYAHDITIQNNIVISATGNTDGAVPTFRPLFSVGIYIDNWAENINVDDNTVIGSTIDGILFQNARGRVTGNTLYNNNAGSMSRGQMGIYFSSSQISWLTNNIFYGLQYSDAFTFAKTLHTESANAADIGTANNNYYFNPYRDDNISIGFNLHTLPEWQVASGHDANSTTNWFNLTVGEDPRSRIFFNDTAETMIIDLGNRLYLDLDQNQLSGSIAIPPFASRILIDSGQIALSPEALYFDDDSSPPQTVTLTNVTGSSLQISSISTTAHFAHSDNCPTTLSIDASCEIEVSFVPTVPGPLSGVLTVSHDSGDPYTADLFGGFLKRYLPIVNLP